MLQLHKGYPDHFELWYQEQHGIQDSSFMTHNFREDKNDFTDDHPKEGTIQSRIEESITKYEQMNDSQVSKIIESMINKTQEAITKFEQLNDDKISAITKSMIDKTQECLTKFEEIDNMGYLLALKHHDRIANIKHELTTENFLTKEKI